MLLHVLLRNSPNDSSELVRFQQDIDQFIRIVGDGWGSEYHELYFCVRLRKRNLERTRTLSIDNGAAYWKNVLKPNLMN